MVVILAVTVICLCVLYLCYHALPMGKGVLLGLAAVITALGGLIAAFVHLLLRAPGAAVRDLLAVALVPDLRAQHVGDVAVSLIRHPGSVTSLRHIERVGNRVARRGPTPSSVCV